ncbi:MAG: ParB/RepB/Spo0J family partition protein [bacterium]|nr:ParB/RepB/Spo0J family partition protein [bacterium]
MDKEVIDLYLDDIIPNRFQPREIFNEQALKELADSIREHGVIQPIIVRKIGDKYEIIAGERRYKASAMAGLTKIPAIIRNLDDKETSKVALLENLQRKDLTPIEEARTYQKILELDSMTQEELGRTMGKSQASIANKMRLLSLPDEVQEALLKDQISERHARSLLNLSTNIEQINMLQQIIDKRMTVRELDSKIKELKGETAKPKEAPLLSNLENNSESSTGESRTLTNQESNIIFDIAGDDGSSNMNNSSSNNLAAMMDIPRTNIVNIIENNKPYEIEELLDDDELYSLKEAINDVKNSASLVEKRGFLVKVEEMDFESTYQIIIKIDKDK